MYPEKMQTEIEQMTNDMLLLYPSVTSFYIYEELLMLSKKNMSFIKELQRKEFINDLTKHRNEFNRNLAIALFDYLALICFGEARHSFQGVTTPKCTNVTVPEIAYNNDRNYAYSQAKEYNPNKYIPILIKLFKKGDWRGGYGGKSWGTIAETTAMRAGHSDEFFIDRVVDLQHNGGLCFDKQILIQIKETENYMNFLNSKLEGEIISNIAKNASSNYYENTLQTTPEALLFIDRACRLGITKTTIDDINSLTLKPIKFKEPVLWGNKEITLKDVTQEMTKKEQNKVMMEYVKDDLNSEDEMWIQTDLITDFERM